MRKLILAAIAVLGFAFTTQAQDSKTVKKTETKTQVVLKKDGTPDQRYKTTKTVVTKKDGTPDMRYKENKTVTKTKTKTKTTK